MTHFVDSNAHYLDTNTSAKRRLLKSSKVNSPGEKRISRTSLLPTCFLKPLPNGKTTLMQAMAANPILIERPVVVNGGRYALGRPPENVLEIL